jgi:hypothetical protein
MANPFFDYRSTDVKVRAALIFMVFLLCAHFREPRALECKNSGMRNTHFLILGAMVKGGTPTFMHWILGQYVLPSVEQYFIVATLVLS